MVPDRVTLAGRRAGPRRQPPADELAPGETIAGRYVIARLLGKGGMGAVYGATDRVAERPVALKMLSASLCEQPPFAERFAREARFTAAFNHRNMVRVLETGDHLGRPFLVMNYLPGETAEQRLVRDGALPLSVALGITFQVSSALAYVHARGWVHRDVKSGNVMIANTGAATLLDFGIMRDAREAALTLKGCTVGTPGYMAPEQATGSRTLDGRADQYALACVLFEMLCERLPFIETNDAQRVTRQLREAAPDLRDFAPAVPAAIARVLARALSANPERRFKTIQAFARALRAAMPNPERVDALALCPEMEWSDLLPLRPHTTWSWVGRALVGASLAMALLG